MPESIRVHVPEGASWQRCASSPQSRTYRITGASGDDVYLKVRRTAERRGGSLRDEARRMRWLDDRISVPRVLALGTGDGYEFLVTTAVAGVPAHLPAPPHEVPAIAGRLGTVLRCLHALDPRSCPFRHPQVGPESARDRVVVHGDLCLPNVLLRDDGYSLVDVGKLAVGDRYVDLVAVIWSLQFNHGDGWDRHLLEAYGMPALDAAKFRTYRDWWFQV